MHIGRSRVVGFNHFVYKFLRFHFFLKLRSKDFRDTSLMEIFFLHIKGQ